MKIIPLQCEYLEKDFYCLTSCTKQEAIKWASKKYKEEFFTSGESDGITLSWADDKGFEHIVIWINNKSKYKKYHIYHECGHAVFHLMKRCGINPCDSHGEHFLYLQEYLANQIAKKLDK